MRNLKTVILGLLLIAVSSGCGYTTGSTLPSYLKTIYVDHVINSIDYSSDRRRNVYFPLVEVKARDAIINRYLFDGNLKAAQEESADLILNVELTSYQRTALRFTDADDVEEYRVYVIVNMEMYDTKKEEIIWSEGGFTGEATYFLEGPNATTEESAVDEAVLDLARRIVERTIEDW